jgi:prepilin-type N-terminal cleavage/methylation domain-containing protein
MKQQYQQKREEGFTIIEVLIVLAIAALILVVVLVAIPQLQRNQRNSARQNDASRVVTSVQNWSANNNGQAFPTSNYNDALESVVNDLGGLAQYDIVDATGDPQNINVLDGAQVAMSEEEDLDEVNLVIGATCEETGGATTSTGVSSRAVAVQYLAETAGGVEGRCVSS